MEWWKVRPGIWFLALRDKNREKPVEGTVAGEGLGVMQSPGSAMNSRGMEREKDVKGPSCTPLFKLSFLSVIVNLLCASVFSPLHRGYFFVLFPFSLLCG